MGYDIYRFKDFNINKEFVCGICHDVMKDPLVIDPCDHIYCSDCITQWIGEQDNCPVDRNKISKHNLHKPLRSFMNLLNELEINCEYSSNGCKQYLKLGELEIHLNNCTFNPNKSILCECGLKVDSCNLDKHQNNCVDYLRIQLNSALNMINTMNTKIDDLENDLKESKKRISILDQWENVDEIEMLSTNMTNNFVEKLIKILSDTLNEGSFDTNDLCEKFNKEFPGNWNIFIGNNFDSNDIDCKSFIVLKIGKLRVFIYMTLKPIHDVLILDKIVEVLHNEIKNKVCNEEMMNSWEWIWHLSDDSLDMSERLLDKDIINSFIQCYELFPFNEQLLISMAGTLCCISEFTELRDQLMKSDLISIILKMLSNENSSVSYLTSYILANILSEGKSFWRMHSKREQIVNRKTVLSELKIRIVNWKIDYIFINFNSFKPLNRLLQCNGNVPQEVHYFAVWTLANFTKKDCGRYCHLLRVDNCISVLGNLIKCSKTEDYVKNLAKLVLYQNQLFLENGNLDKL